MNKFAPLTLMTSGLVLCSAQVAAHSESSHFNFSNDECNIEFSQTVQLHPSYIAISKDQHSDNTDIIQINNQGELFINGKKSNLNTDQEQLLSDYSQGLREHLPQVMEVAIEGIRLAGIAIEEVGSALNVNLEPATEFLDKLNQDIEKRFYQDDVMVFDQKQFDYIGEDFGEDFSSQMEASLESALTQSIGSILMAVGSELMGGGGLSDFEQRMEQMGQAIEEKIELQAVNLEEKAEQLCQSMQGLKQTEHALLKEIPELRSHAIFTI